MCIRDRFNVEGRVELRGQTDTFGDLDTFLPRFGSKFGMVLEDASTPQVFGCACGIWCQDGKFLILRPTYVATVIFACGTVDALRETLAQVLNMYRPRNTPWTLTVFPATQH